MFCPWCGEPDINNHWCDKRIEFFNDDFLADERNSNE